MALTLHTLTPHHGARPKKFRIGRGRGSGRGTTAGRGTKGQRARTGGRKRLRLKGMKQMLLGFPKSRGFQSLEPKATTIRLEQLNRFSEGTNVDLKALKKMTLVNRSAHIVKIVSGGELTRKLTLRGLLVSASAKAALEKAGGKYVE